MFTFNNCTVTVNVGKRIAELLAKLDIDLYTDKGVMMTKILVSPKDLSQFAELIVKECVDQIYPDWIKQGETRAETPLGFAVKRVKEHFGVEG